MNSRDYKSKVWKLLSLCQDYPIVYRDLWQERRRSSIIDLPESELPGHWITILDILSSVKLKIAFDNGLSNSVTTDGGLTLLHVLVKNCLRTHDVRSFSCMLYIMKYNGVDVNIQDDDGNTPIHLCYKGLDSQDDDDVFAQLLYQLGADCTIENNEGKTPDDIFNGLPVEVPYDNQQEYSSDNNQQEYSSDNNQQEYSSDEE